MGIFDYFFSVVILLGVLVAIHEFGHFIVAKYFGVRVETFSLGMGKKILKFTRGETEYALSLIPMGGYVKLTGQDPREEVPPELESRSFRHKPLYQRAAVVLAGPIFNAVLAVAIFVLLFSVGVPVPSAQLQRILPGSSAEKAGFKSGDTITEITRANGETEKIREYSDLETAVANSVGQQLIFNVQRTEGTANVGYSPVLGQDRDSTLGIIKERGIIEGAERNAPAPVLAVRAKSWASYRQVPFGFWVDELRYTANGSPVSAKLESYTDLQSAWAAAAIAQQNSNSGEIVLSGHKTLFDNVDPAITAKLKPEDENYTLSWVTAKDHAPLKLEDAGFNSSELFVIEVKENSPAQKLGLQKFDEIKSVNGAPVLSFGSFKDSIQKLAKSGKPLQFVWNRNGTEMKAEITPEYVKATDPMTEAKKNQFQIGTAFLALTTDFSKSILKANGFADAISLGVEKSYFLTKTMLASFYFLATGEISPKTLGGPILIGKIAGDSFRQGWVSFMRTMAFISLNLFILNLLPVPVLDGGHLLLYCIEAIRRKPLSIKIVELWTTTGFFLLMSLVAVIFFNDLSRLGLFKFLHL